MLASLTDILTSDAVITGVGSLLGLALTWLVGKLALKVHASQAEQEAIEALRVGVGDAWEQIGRQIKDARADGKFTDAEREQLRAHALAVAKEVAKGPGLKLLTTMGKERAGAIISRIVNREKANASAKLP